jgi:hypothetical protein
VSLPVAEPESKQAPHALSSGKGGGGGPPPSQEGPLLARAQPDDNTPLLRALPSPLRRVERSSAVSSEKDSEGSFGETGGHQKKEQMCDIPQRKRCNRVQKAEERHWQPKAWF